MKQTTDPRQENTDKMSSSPGVFSSVANTNQGYLWRKQQHGKFRHGENNFEHLRKDKVVIYWTSSFGSDKQSDELKKKEREKHAHAHKGIPLQTKGRTQNRNRRRKIEESTQD